jgi:hypothetical protein
MEFKSVANLYLPFKAKVENSTYTVVGISQYEDMYQIEEKEDWWNTDNFIPLLKPVSSISISEMKDIWQIVFDDKFPDNGLIQKFDADDIKDVKERFVLSSGVERLFIYTDDGRVAADSDFKIIGFNFHKITCYMLSKGFDLFDLIQNQKALRL